MNEDRILYLRDSDSTYYDMGKSRAEYMRIYRQKKREDILRRLGEQPKKIAKSSTQRSRDHRARLKLSYMPISSFSSSATACNENSGESHPPVVKHRMVVRENVEKNAHIVNNSTICNVRNRSMLKPNELPSGKLPGHHVLATIISPLPASPTFQCTGNKDDTSASVAIKKENIEMELNINDIKIVPVEFEVGSKLDKECLADEFYPEKWENHFICNRFVSDEKTFDVEVQTYVGRTLNTDIKVEPMLEDDDKKNSRIEFTPVDVQYYKKEHPEEAAIFYCKEEPLDIEHCKREWSPT
nr:uncharacterized protein LOC128672538 isoform X2 [Plodia interpunctella]